MALDGSVLERMVAIRRDLHKHPELAFAEFRTAECVARELAACGLSVRTGIGGTGVVGTLARGDGPAIGLRADMDALPITEETQLPYRSARPGIMHACGHDGHVAMLLAAAHHLAAMDDLRGTVHFIFQPAEECEGGGRAMVTDGLFRDHPCDSVWGLHIWPGLPVGRFATRAGAIMASFDTFEIVVQGSGTHAAMPERGNDPFMVTAELVMALQTIVSRRLNPLCPAVVSVTQIHGGDAWNVIPERVTIRGTVRCLDETVRGRIETLIAEIGTGVAVAHGCRAEVRYIHGYPSTVNTADSVPWVARAASRAAGEGACDSDVAPSMASEDFAFMLQAAPGAYAWIGADGAVPSRPLHNPGFDFNDATLPLGAAYWIALARDLTARG